VRTNAVELFDSEGHVLAARVEEKEYPIRLFGGLLKFKALSREVVVEDMPGSVAKAERLKQLIFSYLSAPRVSRRIPSSQQASDQDLLPALIEKLRSFLRKDRR